MALSIQAASNTRDHETTTSPNGQPDEQTLEQCFCQTQWVMALASEGLLACIGTFGVPAWSPIEPLAAFSCWFFVLPYTSRLNKNLAVQPSDYNDVVTQDVHCATAKHDRLSAESAPNGIDYVHLH